MMIHFIVNEWTAIDALNGSIGVMTNNKDGLMTKLIICLFYILKLYVMSEIWNSYNLAHF